MESVALAKLLKELGETWEPAAYESWAKDLRPLLPEKPINHAFLARVLEPMPLIGRATVLEHLARLGRKEVAPFASVYADAAQGFERMLFAEVLMILGEASGYEIIEKLYFYSVEHPDDKEKSAYTGHILDTLRDLGPKNRKAVLLRRKLVADGHERYARKK